MSESNKAFSDTLKTGFDEYGYKVSHEQIEKLVLFNQMVMETNKSLNLTAIEDGAESAKKHFLDSVNPAVMEILKNLKTVIDVGSGAGFPGIPLAIMNEGISFTLLDTRKKRCDFMEEAVSTLELTNVKVVWKRAEELGKEEAHREQYDLACARALAATPTLLEYLAPFVKVKGSVMLYKGKGAQSEISDAKNAASILGVDNFEILPYTIFDENAQYFMVYGTKVLHTPPKYPRKAGLPSKRPL